MPVEKGSSARRGSARQVSDPPTPPSLNLTVAADACLSSEARDLLRRRNEERFAAETTPVPLLTLFALKASLDLEALNSNNVRGGTCLAEAGGAKKIRQPCLLKLVSCIWRRVAAW